MKIALSHHPQVLCCHRQQANYILVNVLTIDHEGDTNTEEKPHHY